MAFEELREQMQERVSEMLAKVQESSAFNQIREQYESQTPVAQKAIVAVAGFFAFLFVMMFPYAYISSGSDSLIAFEENRELIQGLLRASRSANEPPPLPPPMSADTLRGSVERMVKENGLLPEQTLPVENLPPDAFKGNAPKGVLHTGVKVPLAKLNVTQVIEVTNYLQNGLGAGIKLMGIEVSQSAGQTHYYDMVLQIVSFGIPALDAGVDDAPPAKGGRGGAAKKPADEEGFE